MLIVFLSLINKVECLSAHDTTALVTIEFLEFTLHAFLPKSCRENINRKQVFLVTVVKIGILPRKRDLTKIRTYSENSPSKHFHKNITN